METDLESTPFRRHRLEGTVYSSASSRTHRLTVVRAREDRLGKSHNLYQNNQIQNLFLHLSICERVQAVLRCWSGEDRLRWLGPQFGWFLERNHQFIPHTHISNCLSEHTQFVCVCTFTRRSNNHSLQAFRRRREVLKVQNNSLTRTIGRAHVSTTTKWLYNTVCVKERRTFSFFRYYSTQFYTFSDPTLEVVWRRGMLC